MMVDRVAPYTDEDFEVDVVVRQKRPERAPIEPAPTKPPPVQVLNEDCTGCDGENIVNQGGCSTCLTCGWSVCG